MNVHWYSCSLTSLWRDSLHPSAAPHFAQLEKKLIGNTIKNASEQVARVRACNYDSGTETNIGILHTFKCTAIVQTCNSEVVLDPRELSSLEGNVPLQFKNVSQALLMFCEDRTKTFIPQITLPLKYHFFFCVCMLFGGKCFARTYTKYMT